MCRKNLVFLELQTAAFGRGVGLLKRKTHLGRQVRLFQHRPQHHAREEREAREHEDDAAQKEGHVARLSSSQLTTCPLADERDADRQPEVLPRSIKLRSWRRVMIRSPLMSRMPTICGTR